MSKFDRCIFISIAIGIWAFVLTQIFVPTSVVAHADGHSHSYSDIDDFASGVWLYETSYHPHDHDGDYAETWHDH